MEPRESHDVTLVAPDHVSVGEGFPSHLDLAVCVLEFVCSESVPEAALYSQCFAHSYLSFYTLEFWAALAAERFGGNRVFASGFVPTVKSIQDVSESLFSIGLYCLICVFIQSLK